MIAFAQSISDNRQNPGMSIRRWILWSPQVRARRGVLAASLVLTALFAWAHYRSGLSYEFHPFFSLPVIAVAWYLGLGPGLAMAVLTIALWSCVDWRLDGDAATPLLFNTMMRLAVSLGGVWLVALLRRVLEREVRQAREDTLTGLANRRAFYERGGDALALSRRQGAPFTAMFIDLDKFKQVNDGLGHEAGDALLREVAGVLRARQRAGDIAGRLGGDEFALLLPGMDEDAALAYAKELRDRLLAAMRANGWPVTFSMGIASHRRAPGDIGRLLAQADALMYEVKHSGGGRILLRAQDGEARTQDDIAAP